MEEYKDANGNGVNDRLDEIKLKNQRKMSWLALGSAVTLVFVIVGLASFGIMEPNVITSLATILGLYFTLVGLIIGAYFGVSAFQNRNN